MFKVVDYKQKTHFFDIIVDFLFVKVLASEIDGAF